MIPVRFVLKHETRHSSVYRKVENFDIALCWAQSMVDESDVLLVTFLWNQGDYEMTITVKKSRFTKQPNQPCEPRKETRP